MNPLHSIHTFKMHKKYADIWFDKDKFSNDEKNGSLLFLNAKSRERERELREWWEGRRKVVIMKKKCHSTTTTLSITHTHIPQSTTNATRYEASGKWQ